MIGRALCLLVPLLLFGCDDDPAVPDASPAAAIGKVRVNSRPGGAAVISEGERLGKTPLTIERPALTRLRLELIKDGYNTQRVTVHIEPDTVKQVDVGLSRERGRLVVTAGLLRGAKVYLDGKHVGKTPLRHDVEANRAIQVEVRMRGLESYRETVQVAPGETKEVSAALVPQGRGAAVGWLSVSTDAPALVYLDGKTLGQTPLERIPLPARRYRLRIASPGTAPHRSTIEVTAGVERKVQVRLREE